MRWTQMTKAAHAGGLLLAGVLVLGACGGGDAVVEAGAPAKTG